MRADSPFALRLPLRQLDAATRMKLLGRVPLAGTTSGAGSDVGSIVAALIADVRARGDAALYDAAQRFDGARPRALEVPRARWLQALERLDPGARDALEQSARSIERVHAAQRPSEIVVEPRPGVRVGRRPDPLARVGVYAPGGRAAYPSSVLMGVIPARVAGVSEVVVCSPAQADGVPHDAVLAACAIAGADRVFAIGGASAIAALAYGTASLRPVDRIVGPGNAWVDEAKRQVSRDVGVDIPAGPSELLVVCDGDAGAAGVAAELLAQAEHDADAAVVCIALDDVTARAVVRELTRQLESAPRREIAAAALAARGALLIADSIDDALDFAADWAPEHLLLRVRAAEALLPRLRNAGAVFTGEAGSVAHGDYMSGANHVLPTGGAARFCSGLSVLDFMRWTSWQTVTSSAARALAPAIASLAALEGLPAHGAAALRAAAATEGEPLEAKPSLPTPRTPYRDFPLYAPVRPRLACELSANTNRWGVSPAVLELLANVDERLLTEYPTPYADELRDALAADAGVSRAHVTTGCGADDVIDSALRAFCEPGSVLAHPTPTFPMAAVFARMNDLRVATVPLDDAGDFDVRALLAARPRVVYLCSPNNPTGSAVPGATLSALLDATDALVILDEAYAEFAQESLLDLALASERALLVRTFSKASGLAGARVGYAFGAPALIAAVEASRGPYKVGALAERLALAALQDRNWRGRSIAAAIDARTALRAALEARDLRVWPSAANFLLCAPARDASWPGGVDAATLATRLREDGISVRAFPELGGAAGALRITVAPERERALLLEALDALLGAGVPA